MLSDRPWIQQGLTELKCFDRCDPCGSEPDITSPKSAGDSPVVRLTASPARHHSNAVASSIVFNSSLLWWDEAPSVLQFNPYVKHGYRAGNIWIHLLPLLSGIAIVAANAFSPGPVEGPMMLTLFLPVLLCLAGSVTYHTFMANHWNYKRYITLDVCGVFALFLFGAQNCVVWGLYCYPWLKAAAMTSYFATAVVGVIMAVTAKNKVGRSLPMLVMLLLRFAIVITRLILNSGSRSASWNFLCLEVLACTGAVINVMRIPERWFHNTDPRVSGRFDNWFNSHQIMHILVAWAMTHYSIGAVYDYLDFSQQSQCPAWEIIAMRAHIQ